MQSLPAILVPIRRSSGSAPFQPCLHQGLHHTPSPNPPGGLRAMDDLGGSSGKTVLLRSPPLFIEVHPFTLYLLLCDVPADGDLDSWHGPSPPPPSTGQRRPSRGLQRTRCNIHVSNIAFVSYSPAFCRHLRLYPFRDRLGHLHPHRLCPQTAPRLGAHTPNPGVLMHAPLSISTRRLGGVEQMLALPLHRSAKFPQAARRPRPAAVTNEAPVPGSLRSPFSHSALGLSNMGGYSRPSSSASTRQPHLSRRLFGPSCWPQAEPFGKHGRLALPAP